MLMLSVMFRFPLPPGRLAWYQQAGRGWVRQKRNGNTLTLAENINVVLPRPIKKPIWKVRTYFRSTFCSTGVFRATMSGNFAPSSLRSRRSTTSGSTRATRWRVLKKPELFSASHRQNVVLRQVANVPFRQLSSLWRGWGVWLKKVNLCEKVRANFV